jgi:hypothetical protein
MVLKAVRENTISTGSGVIRVVIDESDSPTAVSEVWVANFVFHREPTADSDEPSCVSGRCE